MSSSSSSEVTQGTLLGNPESRGTFTISSGTYYLDSIPKDVLMNIEEAQRRIEEAQKRVQEAELDVKMATASFNFFVESLESQDLEPVP